MTQNITQSFCLQEAQKMPNGARFYKCALQVNPFSYLERHCKNTTFQNETEYNAAIIRACKENNIEAIAVTDHYRIDGSWGLIREARDAGIFAFAGFEANSSDGVHLLCIYDPEYDQKIEKFIGQHDIWDLDADSPISKKNVIELLKCVSEKGGIAISAHVCANSGLLKTLEGKSRINAWQSSDLYAVVLAGKIDDAPQNYKEILNNTNPDYKRNRPIAIINAADVDSPENVSLDRSSCLIKMAEPSVEGLKQAFLDPESRIRLNSDEPVPPHTEFIAIVWEGGFLDGVHLHFNRDLNVLIGGRGAGKSTIIESLRYVLDISPVCDEAIKLHRSVVKDVLKAGTKISLLVRTYHPSQHDYTIERIVPNPVVVRDEEGNILNINPSDIIKGVEVFGQHEISEMTKSREKLTKLLERFIERDMSIEHNKVSLKYDLEKSRGEIISLQKEIKQINERLSALPNLEETSKRFKDAGLEEKLREKSLLVREERILKDMKERLIPFINVNKNLSELIPVDMQFLSERSLDALPNSSLLAKGRKTFERLGNLMQSLSEQMSNIIAEGKKEISEIENSWQDIRKKADEVYQKKLRDLQKDKIDGDEFIKLRQQIEGLQPLKERKDNCQKSLNDKIIVRKSLVVQWESMQAEEHRRFEKAAQRVQNKLSKRVRVDVIMSGNIDPLINLLKEEVGGQLSTWIDRLKIHEKLSLRGLAEACREGVNSIESKFGASKAIAERISQAGDYFFMKIEELSLETITKIELNTASDNQEEHWQVLENLSSGQKATAVLLLLLLESEAPLIIDQPEDDLDNRFITEGVVPAMKKEKCKRQFIFSTHNANIPVLGDAELIIGMSSTGMQGCIENNHIGSIDQKAVREMVEEILEGGKNAFIMRQQKYGF